MASIRKVLGCGQFGNRYIANIYGRATRSSAPSSVSKTARIHLLHLIQIKQIFVALYSATANAISAFSNGGESRSHDLRGNVVLKIARIQSAGFTPLLRAGATQTTWMA
jgi:hypothetical protein